MNAKGIIIGLFLFYIMSVSVPLFGQQASAELISSHAPANLISGEEIKEGVQNIFYLNDRLYVVNIWSGLQVLDVRDVKNPQELGFYTTEYRAFNVFVDERYAYLSQKSGGVILLDVSDPAKIKKVARIKTEGEAYFTLASYPYVYVAEEAQCIGVYDISDVNAVQEIGRFKGNGWAWSLSLQDSILYVGAKTGGMGILDISDPANPVQLGAFSDVKYTKSVQVDDGIAYIAEGPDGLVLADVRNPRQPKLITKYKVDGWVNNAFKFGNTVFLANDQKKRLEIVDVSDPQNPKIGGVYKSENKIYAALKSGIYVYVAADQQSLVLRYNRPPVIEPIANQTVDENQSLMIQPVASDPDQDAIYFTVKNLPSNAIFDSLSGQLSWMPDFEQSSVYKNIEISVIEKTESALSTSTKFDITVLHVNRLPELPEVLASTVDENQTLSFTITEGSDADKEDQGKLTYSVSELPPGALFNPETRMMKWTPTFEQSGVFAFTFTVSDPVGGTAQQATSVTVQHVDREPELVEVGIQTVDENSALQFNLNGTDADQEDQSALSYQALNLPQGAVFDPVSATFSWTPTFEQSGSYERIIFIFTAGVLSDSIRVDINVNHVNRMPQLDVVADQTIDENKNLSFKVSGADSDSEDTGKLVFSAENLPDGAVFNPDSALFSWTPDFEQSGAYPNVHFMITDPTGLSDSKEITITANHVNRTPILNAIEPLTIDENAALTFDLMASDPDKEDIDKLIYTLDNLPEGAVLQGNHFSWTPTFIQSGTYPLQFTVSDGPLSDMKETTITVNHVNRIPVLDAVAAQQVKENAALSFSVSGSDPDTEDDEKLKITARDLPQGASFDSTTAQFNWTPTFEQSGSYTLIFAINDPAGLQAEQQAQVTVEHVNRTPEFPLQSAQTVDENAPLVFNLIAATDPDKEDDGKLVYSVKDLPQGAAFDAENLALNWTPNFEQSSEYNLTFAVADGGFNVEQPLLITVNHVNRQPVMTQPEEQMVDENNPWSLTAVFSDPDKEDEGKLIVEAENLPGETTFDATSATLSWTPTFEQSGNYEGIAVKVTDPAGLSDVKSFSLAVKHVNRAPQMEAVAAVQINENEPVTFTLSATDLDQEDADKLVFSAVDLPQGVVLDASSGSFNWTPDFAQAGAYSVTFKVSDSGGLTAEQSVEIVVADLNRTPQIDAVENKSIKENEALSISVKATDEDTDNTLTYSAQELPAGAAFNSDSGVLSWTPGFDQAGDYSVTFKVSDGKEEAQTDAQITVEDVNRVPKISGSSGGDVQAGEQISLSFSGSDPDGDELTFDASGLPSGADFNSGSGAFSWTPGEDQIGSHTITVSISDGKDSAEMKATISVKAKPAPAPPDTTTH